MIFENHVEKCFFISFLTVCQITSLNTQPYLKAPHLTLHCIAFHPASYTQEVIKPLFFGLRRPFFPSNHCDQTKLKEWTF